MTEVSFPRIKSILESLLFVSKKPLSVAELSEVIGADNETIKKSIEEVCVEFEVKGIQIIKVAGGYQMRTREENAEYVHRLLHSPLATTLSPAALEALSVIAYKQPATRQMVENIRGVASDGVIKTLLEKRLIAEVGRSDQVGRPILYGTTIEFLRHFGLKDLSDLPPLPEGETEQAAALKQADILPPEKTEEETADEEAVKEGEQIVRESVVEEEGQVSS